MKHFTISELCHSDVAKQKKIQNFPNSEIEKHLVETIENLLDPLREQWSVYCNSKKLGNGSLQVSSGFRCSKLNSLVGGTKDSAHLFGYAVDVVPVNKKQSEFENFVENVFVKSGVKFDQIIIEKNKSTRWVHFGYKNCSGIQRMNCFKLKV